MKPMIDTVDLTKKFGDKTAVESLTLHVADGEVFGFLGPNGAGKTTTVRMLTCLISKTDGDARIGEYQVGNKEDQVKIRKMIGLLPENAGLYDDLSAYENLDFYARMYKVPEAQRKEGIERFLKMLELWDKRELSAGTFSKGMKQKLAIARALIHDPQVLFLDEPTANLDPEASKTVRDFILELRKEKKTIFINTHNLDEAQRICDRIGILNTRLMTVGEPESLMESLRGRRISVKLVQVNEAIVAALARIGFDKVKVDGNDLVIDVKDPEKENPGIVEAIIAAGGKVQFVNDLRPTLEDVYLKLVRGQENGP
jgi:ABC-2 type transport system ATP-binding protein